MEKKQTAVEWLVDQIKSDKNQKALSASEWLQVIEQEFAEQMKQIMITSGNKYVKDVNMEVDVTITKVWTK